MANDDFDVQRRHTNIRSQVSQRLKTLIKKREGLKNKKRGMESTLGAGAEQWLERVKEKGGRKKQKLLSQNNKVLYNYGVLNDFFNYSAMTI